MTETGVGDTPLADRANPAGDALDSTYKLVERAKTGDREALDRLFARFLPSLRRWASGRLPRWTRDLMDTDDLVQETVMRARQPARSTSSRGMKGRCRLYLRQAIVNRIRDEIRRGSDRRPQTPLNDEPPTAARHRSSRRSASKPSSATNRRSRACGPKSAKRSSRGSSWMAPIRRSRSHSASRRPMRRGWRSAARCCASPKR